MTHATSMKSMPRETPYSVEEGRAASRRLRFFEGAGAGVGAAGIASADGSSEGAGWVAMTGRRRWVSGESRGRGKGRTRWAGVDVDFLLLRVAVVTLETTLVRRDQIVEHSSVELLYGMVPGAKI